MKHKKIYKTESDLISSLDTQNLSEKELIQKIQEYFPSHSPKSVDDWEKENKALVELTKS